MLFYLIEPMRNKRIGFTPSGPGGFDADAGRDAGQQGIVRHSLEYTL